ncbi:MAG TPA: sulfatase-like hydrolase/transferase [Chitinophagaceae bacterium]|nr:sulfatase-like hydrolase/transferase [Chitinophagaceae bacterium]
MRKSALSKYNKQTKLLFWYFIILNMIPNLYFLFHQPTHILGKLALILFPLGLFLLIFSVVKNIGKWQILLFPLLFLHAFQIVLFYLFGGGVIASDMFLNLVTTNSSEVDELLGALMPAIVIVCILYIPPVILGISAWRKKSHLSTPYRKKLILFALIALLLGSTFSGFATNNNGRSFSIIDNVYPINALYNLGFAIHKNNKIQSLPTTTKDFSFQATRSIKDSGRQIIVLVIGETSRADNWGLYGYNRKTTPRLAEAKNLILFKDALTQANVTHKSVAIILSSVGAKNFNNIFKRKGIFAAFDEVGFKTAYLSNQTESSFIEFFGKEADIYKAIRDPESPENNYDEQLLPILQQVIQQNHGNLFIILHTYGSHFNYTDRYPKAFRKFTPDTITNVTPEQKTQMVNAYDNSILYTDYILSKTIQILQSSHASTAMLYTSDHGEDIFDDERKNFLHSSPYPTYYQLRIPLFLWFSDKYKTNHPSIYQSAEQNKSRPVSTNSIFHTLLNIAEIKTTYYNPRLSLTSPQLKNEVRFYLNDHDKAIPFQKMNLKEEDFNQLKKNHIKY